ncbi:hypothetical protein QFZ66_003965 [Streptomyces sp. B4I13]|nr:hypothetical protein [Streptomyces sp. B4I13]
MARWRANPGELAECTRPVHATEAAALAGISRHRFDRLARVGAVGPVRSYTNRYHAEVWQCSAAAARQLPERRPELLGARLPGPYLGENWPPQPTAGARATAPGSVPRRC